MTNNDIFRRLRYTFRLNHDKTKDLFKNEDYEVTDAMITQWGKKEGEERYEEMADIDLAHFLNGLITLHRGKKDGPKPPVEEHLTNNVILRKLKIALELKTEDISEVVDLTGYRISNHEVSAFFRKPTQRQYRPLKDQILRKFIHGLQLRYRSEDTE